jgi:hypothetical protein
VKVHQVENGFNIFEFIGFVYFVGLIIYSEHINSKKGHIKLYIQRKMIIFNVKVGSKSISLRLNIYDIRNLRNLLFILIVLDI